MSNLKHLYSLLPGNAHDSWRLDESVTHETDSLEFSKALAKEIKRHKKALNVKSIQQNYKGTGSKAHKRQLYIRFNNGEVIDIFLEGPYVLLGGVIKHGYGRVDARNRPPAAVAKEVAEKLMPLGQRSSD